jgi:hypothetical protein
VLAVQVMQGTSTICAANWAKKRGVGERGSVCVFFFFLGGGGGGVQPCYLSAVAIILHCKGFQHSHTAVFP